MAAFSDEVSGIGRLFPFQVTALDLLCGQRVWSQLTDTQLRLPNALLHAQIHTGLDIALRRRVMGNVPQYAGAGEYVSCSQCTASKAWGHWRTVSGAANQTWMKERRDQRNAVIQNMQLCSHIPHTVREESHQFCETVLGNPKGTGKIHLAPTVLCPMNCPWYVNDGWLYFQPSYCSKGRTIPKMFAPFATSKINYGNDAGSKEDRCP